MIKLERKDMYAVLIVFLLAVGIGHFPEKSTLAEFSSATQVRAAVLGQDAPLYAQAAAPLEKVYASLTGANASAPSTIVSFLLLFSSLLLGMIGVLAYFSLRALTLGKSFSAFGAMLLVLAGTSFAFLPGSYGAAQLAMLFFFAFLLPFSLFVKKGGLPALAVAAVFALISGYLDAAFAVAGIGVVLSFCIAAWLKEKNNQQSAYFIVLLALFAAAAFLSPNNALSMDASNIAGSIYGMPFVIAAASTAVVLYFFASIGIECLLLALAGIAVCAISPFAASAIFIIPAAEGMSKATGDVPKPARLACAYFAVFFAVFGIIASAAGLQAAFVGAALISTLAPLLVHFYDYKNKLFFIMLAAMLVALSLFFAIGGQHGKNYPSYVGNDFSNALSHLSGIGATDVYVLQRADAARFYLPSASVRENSSTLPYILSGNPLPKSKSHIIVSVSDVDAMSGLHGFASYRFAENYSDGSTAYALFTSPDGMLLSRLMDNGTFALRDGAALDPYGRYYASVPLSRMILLSANQTFSGANSRLLVLEEGVLPPYLAAMYSGQAPELSQADIFGGAMVFAAK